MYICVCNGVTEKHIAEAIAEGARCLSDLRGSLRVTVNCGKCRSCARECLQNSVTNIVAVPEHEGVPNIGSLPAM